MTTKMTTKMMLRHAMYMHTERAIHRYLLVHTPGRADGGEKATRHMEITKAVVGTLLGIEEEMVAKEAYNATMDTHDATQELTAHLQTCINMPLDIHSSVLDFDKFGQLFFDKFLEITVEFLSKTYPDHFGDMKELVLG